jgi:hypothetical protein
MNINSLKFNPDANTQEGVFNFESTKDNQTNIYTLKINSVNRDQTREPNPFDFEIIFNQKQDGVRAIIPTKFQNIKKLQVSQILIPRYIPRDYIGEPFNGITPLYHTSNSIVLNCYAGININSSIINITDNNGNVSQIEVLELVDTNCKKMYLLALQYNNPYMVGTFINIKADLFSYLNIGGNIYPIVNIYGNVIYLDPLVTTTFPLPLNTNNRLLLADFYKNSIVSETGNITPNIGFNIDRIVINKANYLNYQSLFKNQFLEFQRNSARNIIIERKLFKILNVVFGLIDTTKESSITNNNVTIYGSWVNGYPTNYQASMALTQDSPTNIVRISSFNTGVRDLLDEKIFYLNLYPFVPSKDVSTEPLVNNSFGVFFPSTQSKDYLYLKGEALEAYNNYNLQLTQNKIKFTLLDTNYQILGAIYNSYFNLYNPAPMSILSYLQHSPDLIIILKIEEETRKLKI